MTRVLVLWCPDWPATAVGVDAATAGAVVARGRVAACTAAARAEGVRRGQRLRDAQRRCPELVVRERDTDAEGRLFETVVAAVAALTPRVEVVRPGLCAIPARGPARFYGGEEALRVLVQDAVVEAGHDCGAGIADGLFTAELAARAGQGGVVVPEGGAAAFLAPYPLAVLDRPELADLLRRLGVKTLGDFAALPPGHVAGRFGRDGAVAHRMARGEEPRPLAPVGAAADLSVRVEFDPPAEQAEQVVFTAKRLAGELHEGLAAGGLGCVRLEVVAGFADGHVQRRLWRHDGLSALAVAERVRWQLSAHRPSGDAGTVWGGVTSLELVPDQLVPDVGRQESLWGRSSVTERIARAADRIQALLGHQGITRPVLVGGRGPGERVVRVPVGDLAPADLPDGPWPGRVPAPAPAVVPAVPPDVELVDAAGAVVVVSARCEVSAPPATLRLRGRPAAVTGWTGPWPADERWWDPDRARRRARFQVTTDDGAAYLLAVEGGRWHIEGVYD
ncbi:protein ImuB [Actinomadura pelletieri DSM 43383]|uniref:Protein ImuB n=1 Tax=Actinomadura pelletieri DSM 43383 TaxID=1120940 RepID=A0A495QBS9_9ACTN|nr:DNA polymerase Y family protein [Actinomadura pelletieri]RKS69128.1 protein ImuB [Actinomadura pelletieri DSM 43383]